MSLAHAGGVLVSVSSLSTRSRHGDRVDLPGPTFGALTRNAAAGAPTIATAGSLLRINVVTGRSKHHDCSVTGHGIYSIDLNPDGICRRAFEAGASPCTGSPIAARRDARERLAFIVYPWESAIAERPERDERGAVSLDPIATHFVSAPSRRSRLRSRGGASVALH